MWPFKNKEKKGITLAPGESMELGFTTSWNTDKDEVTIMTNDGPIVLDRKSKLFINVTADNMDPVKLQVIPDFKNRILNFVEIIDPDAKKKFPDGPRLSFVGRTVEERHMSIGYYLKNWDKNIQIFEKSVKKSKRIRDIFVPINIILFIWSSYNFMTRDGLMRYLSLSAAILSAFAVFFIWRVNKNLNRDFENYKELREESFGLVKDK